MQRKPTLANSEVGPAPVIADAGRAVRATGQVVAATHALETHKGALLMRKS